MKYKEIKIFASFFVLLGIIDLIFYISVVTSVDANIFILLLYNVGFSLIFTAITDRFKTIGLIISYIFISIIAIFTVASILIYNTYQTIFKISDIFANVDSVMTNYMSEAMEVISHYIWLIIFFIIFVIASIFFIYNLIKKDNVDVEKNNIIKTVSLSAIGILIIISCILGIKNDTDVNIYVLKYGIKTALLDMKKNNTNNDVLFEINENLDETKVSNEKLNDMSLYNMIDFDFDKATASNTSIEIQAINDYVKTLSPTKKNEYTGIFKGKNVILICAEAYSSYVLDKELTPTLYRLTHNGFYFSDYYVPSWGGSTSGGEYAFITGLVPINYTSAMQDTIGKNMCFTLPRALKREGYSTYAFHNGDYKYYDRHLTHRENIGFDEFYALGNGLEKIVYGWAPDNEMIMNTMKKFHNKKPFCLYYMTLSGHAFYNDSNSYKVHKYIDDVKKRYGDKYDEQVNNYICYQLYLETALKELIEYLDRYGLTNDTVICLTADHYPYGLNSNAFTNGINYMPEFYEKETMSEFDYDKNAPILWSGCLENEYKDLVKEIDTPTSTIDLLPTLLNLFGISFDSRLLIGRDVFSDAEPFVPYRNGSYIGTNVKYSASVRDYIDSHDIKVDDVNRYRSMSNNKLKLAENIVKYDYYDYLYKNCYDGIDDMEVNKMMPLVTLAPDLATASYIDYFKECNKDYIKYKNLHASDSNINRKVIYITIDDGPQNCTESLLDVLDRHNVKATFFIATKHKPEILKQMINKGHVVALHTATHNYEKIYSSEYAYLTDLYDIQKYIYETTGIYSHFVRFPGGSNNSIAEKQNKGIMKRLTGLVENMGFEYFDWNVSFGDSNLNNTADDLYNNFVRGLSVNKGNEIMLLLHDLREESVEALDRAIQYGLDLGYMFDVISDDTKPCHFILY